MKHTTELKLAGGLDHRECATVLAALRNWQLTLTNLGLSDRSGKYLARALAKDMPSLDHFEDGTKPLTVEQIDALCERTDLGPRASIVSVNLDPGRPIPTTDSEILDQIDDLLACLASPALSCYGLPATSPNCATTSIVCLRRRIICASRSPASGAPT